MMGYIKLLRIKNWVKNVLIVVPYIFAAKFANAKVDVLNLIMAFFTFSLISSSVYILNDMMDAESDKKDAHKKNRPIPSGQVKIPLVIAEWVSLLVIVLLSSIFILSNPWSFTLSLTYLALNVLYTTKLKHVPVADVTLLSLFFVIRIYYGALIVHVPVSIYLALTTLSAAYYLGINKRLGEFAQNKEARPVLEKYNEQYLKELSIMFQCLTIVFYSLWIINYKGVLNTNILSVSIMFVIVILIYYKHVAMTSEYSNPVDMVFGHKWLIVLILMFCALIGLSFIV